MRNSVLIIGLWLCFVSLPALAETPPNQFPARCTEGSSPLKECLLDEAINSLHPQNVKSWIDFEGFIALGDLIGTYGDDSQIKRYLTLVNEVSSNLRAPSEVGHLTDNAYYHQPGGASPLKTALGQKKLLRMRLLLAVGQLDDGLAILRDIKKQHIFDYSAELPQIGAFGMLVRRGKLSDAEKLYQETKTLGYKSEGDIISSYVTPEPPLAKLTIAYLDKGDVASARRIRTFCKDETKFLIGDASKCDELFAAHIKDLSDPDLQKEYRNYCFGGVSRLRGPRYKPLPELPKDDPLRAHYAEASKSIGIDLPMDYSPYSNPRHATLEFQIVSAGCLQKFPDLLKDIPSNPMTSNITVDPQKLKPRAPTTEEKIRSLIVENKVDEAIDEMKKLKRPEASLRWTLAENFSEPVQRKIFVALWSNDICAGRPAPSDILRAYYVGSLLHPIASLTMPEWTFRTAMQEQCSYALDKGSPL